MTQTPAFADRLRAALDTAGAVGRRQTPQLNRAAGHLGRKTGELTDRFIASARSETASRGPVAKATLPAQRKGADFAERLRAALR